jgi:hypothetical protein
MSEKQIKLLVERIAGYIMQEYDGTLPYGAFPKLKQMIIDALKPDQASAAGVVNDASK